MPEIATKRARYALSGANAATDVDQGVGVAVHHEGGHFRRSKPFGATARRDDGRELTRDATGAKTAIGGVRPRVSPFAARRTRSDWCRAPRGWLRAMTGLAVVSGWSVEECANLDAGLNDVGSPVVDHDRGDRRQSLRVVDRQLLDDHPAMEVPITWATSTSRASSTATASWAMSPRRYGISGARPRARPRRRRRGAA